MKATVTIPEQANSQEILEFRVNPKTKHVRVTIGEDGQYQRIPVDVTELLSQATATQKTIIRTFFKQVGLAALEQFNADKGVTLAATDIEGDLFEDTVVPEEPI
jgi:hypothetical protein